MKQKLFLNQKLDIIDAINQKVKIKTICAKYDVHKSTISRIIMNRESISAFAKEVVKPVTKVKRITNLTMPEPEKAVYTWFLNERIMQNIVTDKMLQMKAREFHKELNPNIKFEASYGWVQKFKLRHCIRLLKVSGEKLSSNDSDIPQFFEKIALMINEKGLVPAQIYNADETGLVYKFLKDTILVFPNEKYAPGKKKSKERITIMPCTNATGQHKLSLMIIGKSRNPRCFKNVTMPPMHYRSSKNAWQTRELFKEWFLDVFVPQVRQYLININLPPKAVLLDNATSHFQLDPLASDDGNITVYFFPPNTTAILKPLDQHIIRTLKQLYRKKLLLYLISKLGDDLNEKLCKLDLKEVVFIIIEEWNDISERTISKGFRQLLPVSNCEPSQLELLEANERSTHSLYRQVLPDTNLGDVDIMQLASGAHETSCNILTTKDILDDIKEVNNDQYGDSFTPEINTNEVMNSLNLLIDYAESNLKIGDIFILRKLREKVVHKHLMK